MYFSHEVHTGAHFSKDCEALAIGVSFAPEIELGLVADADEKAILRRIRPVASHADRAIDMMQAGVARSFEWNGFVKFIRPGQIGFGLDHFDQHFIVRLIRTSDR